MSHQSKNLFLPGPAGRLEAVLWTPERQAPAEYAALVCHPHPLFGGTLHNKVVYQAAKALDRQGIPVLRFNFRGAGQSEGRHDRGRGEQDDVRASLDFLAAEFGAKPVLLAGFSFGAWVGLRVGCRDGRVAKMIGIGMPVNNSDVSYLKSCGKTKLFVHGSLDEHGDVNRVKEMVAELPGKNQLVVVDGVNHFFAGKIAELGAAIERWVSPSDSFPVAL
jgi:alpha/beta superfamily hydrolase